MSDEIITFAVTLSRGMPLDGEMATSVIPAGGIARVREQSVGLVKIMDLEVDL